MNLKIAKTTSLALFLGGSLLVAESASADNVRAYGSWQDGGDYSSVSGYGIRLSLGAPFGIELGYNRFNSLEIDVSDDLDVDLEGVDTDIWELGLRFGLPFDFYLGGGLSYWTIDDRASLLDDEFGFYALGGWSFGSDNFRGFGELFYRYAESTIDRIFEPDEDIGLDAWGVNAGVMWQW
ncbi:MAG: hypothetical protein U9Q71_09500 [Pseudomonadota bacterium]|nr:hypothetical protein [Pseudomonadota bacterium]